MGGSNWCCGPAGFAGKVRKFGDFAGFCTESIREKPQTNFMMRGVSTFCVRQQLKTHSFRMLLGMLTLLNVGCLNPQTTRFPSWYAWFPAAENEAYEGQYPFSDPDIGPSTDANPRGYERPRSTARRAAEQRVFQGIPVGPESVPAGVPQGGANSKRSVF